MQIRFQFLEESDRKDEGRRVVYWMRDLCGGLSKCKCDAICGGKGDASEFITTGATRSISSDAEGVEQADKEGFGACSVGG